MFSFNGHPVSRMLNSGWIRARKEAGLTQVRVHDLKHTFGRRLRAAGVGFEYRQDLLGHRSGRITTHYSAAELYRLLEAVELVVSEKGSRKGIGDLNRVKEGSVGYAILRRVILLRWWWYGFPIKRLRE